MSIAIALLNYPKKNMNTFIDIKFNGQIILCNLFHQIKQKSIDHEKWNFGGVSPSVTLNKFER